MKRATLLLVLFCLIFVSAVEQPGTGVGDEDYQKIQNITGNMPIDPDTGEVDFSNYTPFKTKADERIAKINEYVGPFSKVLFGVELSLSWIFIFSVALWILLIVIIFEPVNDILELNIWATLVGSVIIATLAMQAFGKDFVVWINGIVTVWYVGLMALLFGAVFGVVYSIMMKYFGIQVKEMKKKSVEQQTDWDRKVIHAHAKLSEMELKDKD